MLARSIFYKIALGFNNCLKQSWHWFYELVAIFLCFFSRSNHANFVHEVLSRWWLQAGDCLFEYCPAVLNQIDVWWITRPYTQSLDTSVWQPSLHWTCSGGMVPVMVIGSSVSECHKDATGIISLTRRPTNNRRRGRIKFLITVSFENIVEYHCSGVRCRYFFREH